MPENLIEKGLFFLDYNASRWGEEKAKYFLVITEGDLEDDDLLCLVLNTEKRPHKYQPNCNKVAGKFILNPKIHKFSFLKNISFLHLPRIHHYTVTEIMEKNIDIMKDRVDENLLRQIKNCIDEKHLYPKELKVLKECYKMKKTK